MKDEIIIFVLVVIVCFVIFYWSRKENFTSVKYTENCVNDCKVYNHIDKNSKCDRICKNSYPENKPYFTGIYKTDKDSLESCECGYDGNYKKELYLSYIDTQFLFNQSEANKICPSECKKYKPESTWSGGWENKYNSGKCGCKVF